MRGRRTKHAVAGRHRLLRVETLEPKLLLAADSHASAIPESAGAAIPVVVTPTGGSNAVLQIRLEASQTVGGPAIVGPIDRSVDATFFINAYVRDLRTTPQGVVGGAIDLSWMPGIVTVGSTVLHGTNFGLFQQGMVDNTANEVDEAGALTSSTGVGSGTDALFFSVAVLAQADGTVTFTGAEGEGTSTIDPANFALVGQSTPVDWDDVLFVNATVQIVSAQPQLPTLSIGDVTQAEGNSGTTQFMFPITLSQSSTDTITVVVNTQDGTATIADSDYSAITNQTVTFAPGDTQEILTVSVSADQKFETNENFSVLLTSVSAGATINDSQGVGTINNDDNQPTISINSVSQLEGDAGATTPFVYELELSNPTSQAVTVQVSTADGTATLADIDYQQFSQQITIQPGATRGMVTVNVVGDDRAEPDEVFNINLASPTGATLGTAAGIGTIRNDDEIEPSPSGISGAVYADTDGNGMFDTDESGIPNVTITLRNAANSVVRTAVTDDQGRYSFTDLPVGTYSVIETHPVAFFDGSDQVGTAGGMLQNDQFSGIPITATTGSTSNNFGENGLQPQFISRRMFLASSPPFSVMLGQIVLATQPAATATSTFSATSIAQGGSSETALPQVAAPKSATSHRTAALSAATSTPREPSAQRIPSPVDSATSAGILPSVSKPSGGSFTADVAELPATVDKPQRIAKSVAPAEVAATAPPPAQLAAINEWLPRAFSRFTAHTLPRIPANAAAVNRLVALPPVPPRRPLASSPTPLSPKAADAAFELEHDWQTSLSGVV